ncbi:DUF4269 domain-containing protein [Paenibacillus sp. CF384]|uniref:DUF4269 domain-containing protein n=1 Tax=Paenibacillus sp. CF384 TaxID=1884382 RepID=UPI000895C390|nr:DUF4269 domain-containing protein [Paenibacillus sp. CF384]SDW57494.1 protein of unknown function [Paenibacillus sp. CF384]
MDWKDPAYLQDGSPAQIEVYRLLKKHLLFEKLSPYSPILVGTVPIGIHVAGSDLDLICAVSDFDAFEAAMIEAFRRERHFEIVRRVVAGLERIKVNFTLECWPIEIFAQSIRTVDQNGYRHMVVEARMLALFGPDFQSEIMRLKESGLKTEPAFAKALKLEGDPCLKLLELAEWTDEQLLALIVAD